MHRLIVRELNAVVLAGLPSGVEWGEMDGYSTRHVERQSIHALCWRQMPRSRHCAQYLPYMY